MAVDIKRIAGVAAKCGFIVSSRIAGFTLLGVVLNAVLLAFLMPELRGASASARTVLVAGFGLVFPAAFLLMGKKHGIEKAIGFAAEGHVETIVGCALDQLFAQARKLDGVLSRKSVLRALPDFARRLTGLPWPLRWILGRLFGRIDFGGTVGAVLEKQADGPLSVEAVSSIAHERLTDAVREALPNPGLTGPAVLTAIDLAAFVAAKLAL